MNKQEALALINQTVRSIKKNDSLLITEQTDLIQDKVLDSLDGLIFFMELDSSAGLTVADEVDLVQEGYFKVAKLLQLLCAPKP